MRLLGQSPQLLGGVGDNDTAADIENGLFGFIYRFGRRGYLSGVPLGANAVTGQLHLARVIHAVFVDGYIDWYIDQNRAGPAGRCDMKGLAYRPLEVFDILNDAVVFRDRTGNACRISFLEGIISDQLGAHLAGQGDQWDRVHHRCGQSGYEIARAGAAGGEHDADLAAGASVGIGHVTAALFVTRDDKIDRRVV